MSTWFSARFGPLWMVFLFLFFLLLFGLQASVLDLHVFMAAATYLALTAFYVKQMVFGSFIMIKERLLERFSPDQLDDAVRFKQDQFAGLLTEEAAMRVLAHEAGFIQPPDDVAYAPLQSAKGGQLLCARVRALAIFAPKRFATAERSGRLCKIRVADSSGAADLVLWNSDVDLASVVSRNDVLLLKDVFVKVQQPLELHSRLSSEVRVAGMATDVDAALPLASVPLRRLNELADGVEADVVARLVEKQPLKEFQRQGKIGYLSRIKLSDGSAESWAACWDGNAHVAQRFDVGDAVKIEGAVLKNGELSVSWSGRLLPAPSGHGLGEVAATPHKSLADLDGSDAVVEVRIDKVVDAQRLHKCRSCGAKSPDKTPVCACGSEDFSSLTYASLELSDSSGQFRGVMFDAAAEAFLGAKSGTDLNLLTQLKRDYLAGKNVKLLAYAKKSAVSGQKEIVGKAVLGWNNHDSS